MNTYCSCRTEEGEGQEEGQGRKGRGRRRGREEGEGQEEGQGERGRGRREEESMLDSCKILLISHTCRSCNGEAGGATAVTGRLSII